MQRKTEPSVLVVGPAAHGEFLDALNGLRDSAVVTCVEKVADGIRVIERQGPPDVVVLAQVRPGEMASDDVSAIQKAASSATPVALLGSWCEGESRTSPPWPEVPRRYWYELNTWWQRHLESQGWHCPGKSAPGLVVVDTPHRETFDTLADALQVTGNGVVWHQRGQFSLRLMNSTVGIWEGGKLIDDELAAMERFFNSLPQLTHRVVLLDFPRRKRVEAARSLGATAVLSKPWREDDLLATICGTAQANTVPWHQAAA